ncbi:MAG TPA: aspartate aminotransferase family protein [Oceanospirillaceae bacterium]|nr:aspartate aminotransferase family protein [Oceanospirillaceae bacterium]
MNAPIHNTESNTEHDTKALQELDKQNYMHPFTDSKAMHEKGTRIVTGADGCYIFDSEGGKVLDGMAGLWCVNIGYGRDELADVAAAQMRQLPYYNSFFGTAHPPVIKLAAQLKKLAPDNISHVFFTGSGSESNDTNIRMVRHYWQVKGQPTKRTIISRHNAYHGSTMASMSLGGMKGMHEQGGIIDGVEHIMQPHWYHEALAGETEDELGLRAAQALEVKILELGAENVGAFIGEPVQGAGAVIVPPATYWPEIQRICKKYDLLLIADEVITGFGRTGNWFACETYGIEADLMPIAKGLSSGYMPIGGVLISERVAKVVIDGGEFAHGYTYSGHPVAAAVASANVSIIENEGMVEQVRDVTGPYLQQRLAELLDHPLVGQVRGVGLMAAFELVQDKASHTNYPKDLGIGGICRDYALANGLVMRAVGESMILCPPLVISKAEIDELMDIIKRSLDQTLAQVSG